MPGRILSEAEIDDIDFSYIITTATRTPTESYPEEQQEHLDELRTRAVTYVQRGAREQFETVPMNEVTRTLFSQATEAAHEFTASRAALVGADTQASERHYEATAAWIRAGAEFFDAVHEVLETRDQNVREAIERWTRQQEAEELSPQQQQLRNDPQALNGDIAQVLNGNGAQRPNGNGAQAATTPHRPPTPGTGQQRRRGR
ncbi:hypothetical protein [Streptomyces fumanus]|uniref:Uncharacterized protein n=1 Tax=Streptomyces fumanus TaxID=67302 RepID=A0A919A3V4_9ACTN|nr:hypothetical protein [Streptomyces fumanus]GHE85190.1 hypothetical protein GCM10018772_05480 [Streptomyces fumanus]